MPSRQKEITTRLWEKWCLVSKDLGNLISHYYNKLTLLNSCKIFAVGAVFCIIAGIYDFNVKTAAQAANITEAEAVFQYLRNLQTPLIDKHPVHKTYNCNRNQSRLGKVIGQHQDNYHLPSNVSSADKALALRINVRKRSNHRLIKIRIVAFKIRRERHDYNRA